MLAETCEDMTKLTFPLLASPKLDGIRCLLHNGVAFSRSLKPLPNQFIQKELAKLKALHGADGELMVGETFQAVTSGVMSRDGEPDFALHVFDRHDQREGEPFANRLALAERDFAGLGKRVKLVPHLLVNSIDELRKVVDAHLASGYEGTMIRSLDGPYKNGRSSLREGYLLKLKPFKDDEAIVTGFYEQEENLNEKKTSELGLSKRSSHQANKRGKGTLGGFYVKHATFGNFNIGTGRGLTAELRQHIWNNQAEHMGKLVKFRYQEAGTKDKPRIPVFLGFRSPDDL
jgi:DNA ligase-1